MNWRSHERREGWMWAREEGCKTSVLETRVVEENIFPLYISYMYIVSLCACTYMQTYIQMMYTCAHTCLCIYRLCICWFPRLKKCRGRDSLLFRISETWLLIYFVVLGFELRALCLGGRCATTWVMPTTHFALDFWDRVLLLASLDHFPPILSFHSLSLGLLHSNFFCCDGGLTEFFCTGGPGTTVFLISGSHIVWNDRHTMQHHAQLLVEMGSHELFASNWPRTEVLLISISQVA
jgi:hypothetical protein